MGRFDELVGLKKANGFVYVGGGARAVLAPDLGARVFCELNGVCLHRLDMDVVRSPVQAFNNYGGNNFWPAPEGGVFGFNYNGDEWYVQPAINNEPFVLDAGSGDCAKASKQTCLINRKGVEVSCVMEREFRVVEVPEPVAGLGSGAAFAYVVDDRIRVLDDVSESDAMVACWTLEQFDAGGGTVSFAKTGEPTDAVNFDFYADPRSKIEYGKAAVFYKTDSKLLGQIGIKKSCQADYVGFYDLERGLLCVRKIIDQDGLRYFNIADNDQPDGPYSAADNYSIFNGGEEQGFFEVETIGGAIVEDGYVRGSAMSSLTCFALFDDVSKLEAFVEGLR